MDQLNTDNGNKRSRDESGLDSVPDSPELKRVNSGAGSVPELSESDPTRISEPDVLGTDVDLDWQEAKQIREDILDILDEPDVPTDCTPEIRDLDSVMKSFEEEILHRSTLPDLQTVLDLTSSESGESQPDLGYLLEASDDDLGLPPTVSPANEQQDNTESSVMPEASELANMVGFEDEIPNYDTFDFVTAAGATEGYNDGGNNNGDFVTVGGLFDYPEPSDFSEFSWRQESLPAL